MKTKLLTVFILIFCFGCKQKDEENSKIEMEENPFQTFSENESEAVIKDTHSNMVNWKDYYKSLDADFELNKFKLDDKHKLETMPGSVSALYDQDFDEKYEPFLIYNSTKEMYIDMDSYSMTFEDDDVNFEPDQEINVVNIPKKTVTRIGFYGPSYWVEDAFWKDDHTVILLENNDEKVPMIVEINLKSHEVTRYVYSDTLKNNSDYAKQRIQKIRKKK